MSALAELLSHPAVWRGSALGNVITPSVPTGFPALDAELPGGGWPAAALTEILPQHEGIGELRILGHALASLSARGRWLAWIAPPYLPYAPALQAAGMDLARLIVVRTRSPRETLWAAEQALRSNSCGAVLAWPEKIAWPESRRLQLAAAGTQVLAFLFRPPRAAGEASPAARGGRNRKASTCVPAAASCRRRDSGQAIFSGQASTAPQLLERSACSAAHSVSRGERVLTTMSRARSMPAACRAGAYGR